MLSIRSWSELAGYPNNRRSLSKKLLPKTMVTLLPTSMSEPKVVSSNSTKHKPVNSTGEATQRPQHMIKKSTRAPNLNSWSLRNSRHRSWTLHQRHLGTVFSSLKCSPTVQTGQAVQHMTHHPNQCPQPAQASVKCSERQSA